MKTRTAGLAIGAALVVHNLLRVVASRLGEKHSIFNYLGLVGFRKTAPDAEGYGLLTSAPPSGVLWAVTAFALAVSAWALWRVWRKPPEAQPLWASALLSALSAAAVGLLMVMVSTAVETTYGWALFVLLPVLMGMQSALLLGKWRQTSIGESLIVAVLSVALLGLLLLGIAWEGVICLVMAAPLAVPLAMAGAVAGYALQRSRAMQNPVTFLLLAGISPFTASLEHAIQPTTDLFIVSTSIELRAPPDRVWKTITEAAVLPAPTQPLFRTGIAYPRSSYIKGSGPDATRYCEFSTGKLVEPVLIWDYPRQLRFRVASNPLPMEEWSPYSQVHPPHLDGFLISKQGEYKLTPLPGGGTRLEATTWYRHSLWPSQYWRWWSDYIIHQVHGLVLANIRERADG